MEFKLSEHELTELFGLYSDHRSLILDTVEQELKDSPRWPFIRSRLLRYLGESGFEGKLKRLFHFSREFAQ